jgi:hypothetical protein
MERYEKPVVIASYTVAQLKAEAAVICSTSFKLPD